jgi:hypothetical protein
MPRTALAFAPTFNTITEKRDAYVDALTLRRIARDSGRYWSFHKIPTTVALPSNCFAKSLNGFADHQDEEPFMELLREYAEYGVPRPSGYADVFHEIYRSPRVKWSTNSVLAPALAGGWQACLIPGAHKGTYYKYDIRSAYLWAASLGMPDSSTYQRCLKPWRVSNGVFRLKLVRRSPLAPFPFNQARQVLATSQEIEQYGLQIGEVVDGVTWSGLVDGAPIIDAVRKVSTWKQAARAFWGRWGQAQKVTCTANGKTWQLPNIALNIPWSHTIISRVRMRLWEVARDAVHVFIDSVITPHIIPTGDAIGDWRLEKTYNAGVLIRAAGQYGALDEERLERYAGRSMNSLDRNTSVALANVATRPLAREKPLWPQN